ncbi:MAG: metal ABC transporter ATP-binding protein [Microthrixaceae bacterium]
MSPNVAVAARDLTLAHGDEVALSGVGLDLPVGSLVAFIGPNGSGKSTLLDAIAGLLKPRSGQISAPGHIAYVFQSTVTPAHLPLTVREVVTMGRYRRTGLVGRVGSNGRAAIADAMERLEITDLSGRQLQELSGGQRQRVLVAQGLAAKAELLLLDEPMIGLDLVSQKQILGVLDGERSEGRTVIFTTHDMAEAKLADLVVLLAGRVVALGPPSEVLTDDNLRAAYMGRLLSTPAGTAIDDPHHH